MYTTEDLTNPQCKWIKDRSKAERKISSRKMAVAPSGNPSQALNLPTKLLASLAVNWHFSRFPPDREEVYLRYQGEGIVWKNLLRESFTKEKWTRKDRDQVVQTIYKLTDHWPKPPRNRNR